jgi:hypothetical protein
MQREVWSLVEWYWIVDYDLPVRPYARRRAFYRGLHRILRKYEIVADRSTQSVWVLDRRRVAEEIHRLAQNYGRSHFYEPQGSAKQMPHL